jgi:hypothetical protein
VSDLSKRMQARLDKWRQDKSSKPQEITLKHLNRFSRKFEYGDVYSLEELESEHKKSQTRK